MLLECTSSSSVTSSLSRVLVTVMDSLDRSGRASRHHLLLVLSPASQVGLKAIYSTQKSKQDCAVLSVVSAGVIDLKPVCWQLTGLKWLQSLQPALHPVLCTKVKLSFPQALRAGCVASCHLNRWKCMFPCSASLPFILCETGQLWQGRIIFISNLEERIVSHRQKQNYGKEALWNFTEESFSCWATWPLISFTKSCWSWVSCTTPLFNRSFSVVPAVERCGSQSREQCELP